jgi:hypothetical protein
MKEHYPTITPSKSYNIELIESAMFDDGNSFMDYDVHKVLEAKHIKKVAGEWYKCSISDVKAAIVDVKTGCIHYDNRINTFKMRPEQEKALGSQSTSHCRR